jgi:hypothetical protein
MKKRGLSRSKKQKKKRKMIKTKKNLLFAPDQFKRECFLWSFYDNFNFILLRKHGKKVKNTLFCGFHRKT